LIVCMTSDNGSCFTQQLLELVVAFSDVAPTAAWNTLTRFTSISFGLVKAVNTHLPGASVIMMGRNSMLHFFDWDD
jgi:hypothetical protein